MLDSSSTSKSSSVSTGSLPRCWEICASVFPCSGLSAVRADRPRAAVPGGRAGTDRGGGGGGVPRGREGRREAGEGPAAALITNMPGKSVLFADVEVDEEKKTISLSPRGGPPGGTTTPTVHVLRYREVEPELIEVE